MARSYRMPFALIASAWFPLCAAAYLSSVVLRRLFLTDPGAPVLSAASALKRLGDLMLWPGSSLVERFVGGEWFVESHFSAVLAIAVVVALYAANSLLWAAFLTGILRVIRWLRHSVRRH